VELAQGGSHWLAVEEHHATAALDQLRRYEEENRGFRLRRVLPPAAPFALPGTLGGAFLLVALALLQWRAGFDLAWLEAGAARAGAIRAGEFQRAITALTLHVDVPHLLANLVFGGLFCHLLFHAHGGGLGPLALLAAGALGNLLNAWVQAPTHASLGASTAVFAAVGLLAGAEARARHLLREPRARRLAPVGAALLLLLYLGVGEVRTAHTVDVLAHVFGLLAGLLLGPLLASLPRAWVEQRAFQAAGALVSLLVLGLAWYRALCG
jgi:membrane associated rhomboid family serine protease